MHYKIIINGEKETYYKNYSFLFNRVYSSLELSENCGLISFDVKTKTSIEKFIGGRNFAGLIKRIQFAHFICYGRKLIINSCSVKINEEQMENVPVSSNIQLEPSTDISFPQSFLNEDLMANLLKNLTKTNLFITSFTNYIFAACCNQEINRFMYLWMSFNGSYNYLGQLAAEVGRTKSYNERQLLKIWGICFDSHSNYFEKKKNLIKIIIWTYLNL